MGSFSTTGQLHGCFLLIKTQEKIRKKLLENVSGKDCGGADQTRFENLGQRSL